MSRVSERSSNLRNARLIDHSDLRAGGMKKSFIAPKVSTLKGKKFEVGSRVELYCDHIREGGRVRDWLQGVVVQSDPKMVAVQFVQDVYLTDGWMVPDRVLWSQQNSHLIRPASKRRVSKIKQLG